MKNTKRGGYSSARGPSRIRLGLYCAFAGAAALSLILSAGPARSASAPNTVQLRIVGQIPPQCGFTAAPDNSVLPIMQQNLTIDIGELAFSCNITSLPVSLTISSANGGLKRQGGSEVIPYAVAWDVQGRFEDFGPASAFQAGVPFSLNSGGTAVAQRGRYKVRVTGDPSSYAAGTYEDTITYTISP